MTNEKKVATEVAKPTLNADNLVTNWKLLQERNGVKLVDAIDAVNKAVGRKYNHSHVSRMETGERSPGAETMNFMMQEVVMQLFEDHALPAELGRKICKYVKVAVDEK